MKIHSLKYILIVISIVIAISIVIVNKESYNYYEISECTIPVSKKYNIIEQTSKYEYRFIYNGLLDMKKISIFNSKKTSLEEIKNTILKKMKPIYEKKIYDFLVIKQKNKTYKIHVIMSKTSTLFLINETEEYLDYLIEYCEKTN